MATQKVSASDGNSFTDEESGTPETTINIGDTVLWVNDSGSEHTIVSDNVAPFDTLNPSLNGDINPGEKYSRTFNQAGTFGYHCDIHGGDPVKKEGMYGIVHVKAAAKY